MFCLDLFVTLLFLFYSSLRRQEEEGAIWQELYDNHRMLKSSVSSRFTWADILHGVVDVLPPRDYSDDVTDSGGGVSKAEGKHEVVYCCCIEYIKISKEVAQLCALITNA